MVFNDNCIVSEVSISPWNLTIVNAGLHKLGGLVVVVEELNREEEGLRILAAWILGKASQNNGVVQDQVIHTPQP